MIRIVRENYPVADLPEDLRKGLSLSGTVTVTIESISGDIVWEPVLAELMTLRSHPGMTSDQIQAQIDELREDRDL